jgi:putative DNA primase/helicase
LSVGNKHSRNCIAVRNGIVDLDWLLAGRDDFLIPHTPRWFSTICLSYPFDADADCPRWKETLQRNLEGDVERISLLQEWAGYLLTPDTSHQKFLVLEGEGANGKSVYCAGITAMLGKDAVSNLPLEMFGQRFQLTCTLGKLANIAADCGELDKIAEGHLKTFTSGDRMHFDRKGMPGVDRTPTARMMMATNNRPRFSDRSGGLWRRMLLVPFRIEVPQHARVLGMDKHTWWEDSGECPGIFNWAVAGLHRLRQQGHFTASSICTEALEDYKTEVNPAKEFLTETCEENSYAEISCSSLYDAYKKWCNENGYRQLGERQFGKEVKRLFPRSEKRRTSQQGDREYKYFGILTKKEGLF